MTTFLSRTYDNARPEDLTTSTSNCRSPHIKIESSTRASSSHRRNSREMTVQEMELDADYREQVMFERIMQHRRISETDSLRYASSKSFVVKSDNAPSRYALPLKANSKNPLFDQDRCKGSPLTSSPSSSLHDILMGNVALHHIPLTDGDLDDAVFDLDM